MSETNAAAAALRAEDIAGAERLAAVEFTDGERGLMLQSIAAQVALIQQRRGVSLPLALAPATRFDPRLPGFAAPAVGRFRPADAAVPPLPEDEAAIAFASVATLGGWIRAGRLSARQLARIYLDRIARLNPALDCVATLTPELAMQQAEQADRTLAAGTWLGPLHGIPWGCKDILDTAGIVTGWGAEPWRDRVPDSDATVVRLLREAGAVLLGKLSVGALAYGDIWYGGRTRNPWNRLEGSSGSSAGSGAATAAGLVGFSLGTETLGSIVAPSLRCGVTGLRPSFGRVSRSGAMPLCWTLDKIGPMARTVDDTALILAALNAPDAADPCQIPMPFGDDATQPLGALRVGYYEADFADPASHALDRAALDAVRGLGLELVALQRPELPYASLMNTLMAEAAASFEALTLSDQDDLLTWQEEGAWPNTFRKALLLPAVNHIQLDRLRRLVMQDMDATFRGVDVIIGHALLGPMLIITNFTGHPCLALPVGLRESETRAPLSLARARLDQGAATRGPTFAVPHAVCLWGRLYDEGPMLRLGRALEAHFGFTAQRPPLA